MKQPAYPTTASLSPPFQQRRHIGALDGVRGLAIILVLIFHFGRDSAFYLAISSPLLKVSSIGWVGVDLFFVLSGFLITGILYDSRHSKNYLRTFYIRRVLRIFPLYYGGLIVLIILLRIAPERSVLTPESIPWHAFYLTNVLIALDGWPAVGGALAHWWSLSVEEHFYLVWPFVLMWGTRQQLMAVAAALAVFALALRIALLLGGSSPDSIYVLTPTRMDLLAIGALCSLAVRGPYGASRIVRPVAIATILCVIALLIIVVSRGRLNEFDPVVQSIGFSLLALTFGGGIIVGTNWQPLKSVLEFSALRWFGRYSYGLYFWHPIVITLLFKPRIVAVFGVQGMLGKALYTLLVLAVSILVAVLSFHCWEKHFLNLKDRYT